MKKENDDKLCKEFPELFKDRHAPATHTAMCWGFQCSDGWFDIIYNLCKKIKELDPDGVVVATTVKEKFGGLRFYWSSRGGKDRQQPNFKAIQDVVGIAEDLSYKTCEVCGKPGRISQLNYWWSTLCEEHERERKEGKKVYELTKE
jgi:hypothetical protein